MKRFFLIVVLLTCALTGVYSQNVLDVVYLKNGSIIKGIIIEQIPNESIKIETKDGSIFVYKISEIDKMAKDLSNKKSGNIFNSTNDEELSNGFKFFMETGYTLGQDNAGRIELLTSAGSLINKYLYIGAGIGLNYYGDAEDLMLPIYGNIRFYVPTGTQIHPYIDMKSGYSLGLTTSEEKGLYINATAGIQISNFTVGIGYASQTLTYDNYYDDYSESNGGFAFRVGLTF